MILFYGEGRLGNQVFQYQALNHIAAPREKVFSIGLEDIESSFTLRGVRISVLTRSLFVKRVAKFFLLPAIVRPLAQYLRLFNYAYETLSSDGMHSGQSGEYKVRRGLFSKVTFVDGGYYQNADFSTPLFPISSLWLKDDLRLKARSFLEANVPHGSIPIFVHVRRGDYLHFSSYGVGNLSLPENFYRAAIAKAKELHNSAHFIFVTDDPEWVTNTFADTLEKSITSSEPRLDFAIMTECRGAVLSNSTFSLAAALLLRDPEIVIGPMYWLGFRVGRWLPPRIRINNPKLIYLPVLAEPQQ